MHYHHYLYSVCRLSQLHLILSYMNEDQSENRIVKFAEDDDDKENKLPIDSDDVDDDDVTNTVGLPVLYHN